jgi:hypothetical protein
VKIPNFSNLIQVGKSVIMANRPELMLGAAVAATVGAVVLAAQGGYKSGKAVAAEEIQRETDSLPPITKAEIVALTWKNYTPAAGVAVGALGSIVGLHIVHVKDKKALVAAGLAAVEEAKKSCRLYIDDIDEAIRENATDKTRAKIDTAILEKNAERNGGKAMVWNDGVLEELYLCRDALGGRDIWSNQAAVKEAVADLNGALATDDMSLNDFYDYVGLEVIPEETRGWNAGEKVEIQWTVTRRGDGRPVCVYKLNPAPAEGHDKSHA